jgi:hypothetical protein
MVDQSNSHIFKISKRINIDLPRKIEVNHYKFVGDDLWNDTVLYGYNTNRRTVRAS